MKKRRNKKESFSNWKKGKNNPAFNSAATNNEKAGHTNPGEPGNGFQFEKIINNFEILKPYEDEIRERKFWRVIKLLLGLALIALIIFICLSNPISPNNPNPKNLLPAISPSLIWISIISLISSFAFFFLKLFREDFTAIKNTRREHAFFQVAIEKEDNPALSEIVEYFMAFNRTESNLEGSISESDSEDEENMKVKIPKTLFNKFVENLPSLRPTHQ